MTAIALQAGFGSLRRFNAVFAEVYRRPPGAIADPGGMVAAAVRRTGRRLVWFLILLYALAVLDRINVGFAAVTMNPALGLTPSMFGFGASMFLVGYLALEVPSNLMLVRYG